MIPFGLKNFFWLGDDALTAPLEITRTPQPEISFLVLLAAVAITGRALGSGSRWNWTVAAGVASGAVIYCYYYYALAWGIALVLMLVSGLIWNVRARWLCIAKTLFIMLLVSLPFGITAVRGKLQGGQTYLLERMGAFTHGPDFFPLICALLLTLLLFKFGKQFCRAQPTLYLLALLVAGSLYGMNFQIFSGYETQRWHFWKRLALPVCFFLLATAAGFFAEKILVLKIRRAQLAAYFLFALLVLNTTTRVACAALNTAPFQRASNPQIAMLRWARSNLPSNRVVGTVDPELILLIPALTSDYSYVPSGLRSLTSTEEIVSRYFELACMLGLSPSQIEKAAAVPNHLAHSTELLHTLGLSFTGDPSVYRWFVNRYRSDHAQCRGPSWRLDYLAIPAGDSSAEAAIAERFPGARVIYRNSEYLLLETKS
ncbi:MAG: hypothetical protein M3Y72_16970 [Acidobacteriota bacterium]|nr:hypothetical protein [Acidobacteriota bacterium]